MSETEPIYSINAEFKETFSFDENIVTLPSNKSLNKLDNKVEDKPDKIIKEEKSELEKEMDSNPFFLQF